MSTFIDVTCRCGATLKAKPEHAGKTGKCPTCKSVVVIPLLELTDKDVLSQHDELPDVAGASIADLLDDTLPQQVRNCPSCSRPLPAGAILCVSCGYHLHVLQTRRSGKETILPKTISRIGAEAIPALVEAYENEDPRVRIRVTSALWHTVKQTGPCQEALEAVPTLMEALGDEDYRVSVSACAILEQLGPHAKQAIPALEEVLGHGVHDVRKSAAGALSRIRGS